ncbi:endonuclease domain-containing protein [Streptomyces sp. NPDC015220]|uniref:endonuclease domain-containing protein n=1 Tax=Streptomyces sp. NPDC015220 TaxID=3364947 RepID=UPI003701DC7B
MSDVQRCGMCKQERPLDEFSPSYRGRTGTWCRPCNAAYARGERPEVAHQSRDCDNCGEPYVPRRLKVTSAYCSKRCRDERRRVSGRTRDAYLRRKYGIGLADYERMLAGQGGGCAVCGAGPGEGVPGNVRHLHVDRCERTGRVRGLLCAEHGRLVAQFGTSPELLRRAAAYVEAASR